MSRKVSILFEVTEEKTSVIGLGSNGKTMSHTDITDTDMEEDFKKLLRKIQKHPAQLGVRLIPSSLTN